MILPYSDIHCISVLLLHNKLPHIQQFKTTQHKLLSHSLSESGVQAQLIWVHCLGSSKSERKRSTSVLIWRLNWGRSMSKLSVGKQIHFLQLSDPGIQLEAILSLYCLTLSALKGCSHFLNTTHSPLSCGLPQKDGLLIKAAAQTRIDQKKSANRIQYNFERYMISHRLFHILSVRLKQQVPSTIKKKGFCKGINTSR